MKEEIKVFITVGARINAQVHNPDVKFPYIPAPTPLWEELRKWLFENKIFPGGVGGPSFFHSDFTPAKAMMLERWFEEHGVQVQYQIEDEELPEKGFTFDRQGKWVDHDPLNPMRVPPGYALLKMDEQTAPGDILWHPGWCKWMPLPGEPTTAKEMNLPVARKVI